MSSQPWPLLCVHETEGSSNDELTLNFHHGIGRAGLQPRRYKAFLIIPVLRAPRSLRLQAARGAERTEGRSRDFGGAEAPPFRQPPKPSQRGEKCEPYLATANFCLRLTRLLPNDILQFTSFLCGASGRGAAGRREWLEARCN